jgi:hypothetical protein
MASVPEEWFRQQRPKWISLYYADYLVPGDVEDTQRALHEAVITGAIRAKLNRRLLTKEEAAEIARPRCGDANNPYGLPSDLELSVEDAERIWPASSARGSDFYKGKT